MEQLVLGPQLAPGFLRNKVRKWEWTKKRETGIFWETDTKDKANGRNTKHWHDSQKKSKNWNEAAGEKRKREAAALNRN